MEQKEKLNEFSELEFKYNADEVGLKQFTDLMEQVSYNKQLTVSSWDIYYTKPGVEDEFIRFRESVEKPELTIKRKVKDANNFKRIEVDVPLDPNIPMNELRKTVEEFVKLEGYTENFKIYKSCFIYWKEFVNYVYYIVYDEQMREQSRFIEVEFNKDKLKDFDQRYVQVETVEGTAMVQEHPEDYLRVQEKKLEVLGITNRNRLKRSLFEMFRRA